jgi:hypothetical protein
MADRVQTAIRLRADCNPTAAGLHSDCRETALTSQNFAALSTVAGVRRFTRTQARRGGKRHGGRLQERTVRIWT